MYHKGRTIRKTIGWGGAGDVQQILMQGNVKQKNHASQVAQKNVRELA